MVTVYTGSFRRKLTTPCFDEIVYTVVFGTLKDGCPQINLIQFTRICFHLSHK